MHSNKLRYSRQRPTRHRFMWDKCLNNYYGSAIHQLPLQCLCCLPSGILRPPAPGFMGLYCLARLPRSHWRAAYCLFSPQPQPLDS